MHITAMLADSGSGNRQVSGLPKEKAAGLPDIQLVDGGLIGHGSPAQDQIIGNMARHRVPNVAFFAQYDGLEFEFGQWGYDSPPMKKTDRFGDRALHRIFRGHLLARRMRYGLVTSGKSQPYRGKQQCDFMNSKHWYCHRGWPFFSFLTTHPVPKMRATGICLQAKSLHSRIHRLSANPAR